jgi:hypothetical protein
MKQPKWPSIDKALSSLDYLNLLQNEAIKAMRDNEAAGLELRSSPIRKLAEMFREAGLFGR